MFQKMPKTNFFGRYSLVLFVLLVLMAGTGRASWTPPNADATFPRTLFKVQELPALRAHLTTQPAHDLVTQLWSSVLSYAPGSGPFLVDGHRRRAAFNAKNCAFFLLLDRKPGTTGLDTLTPSDRDFLLNRAIFLLNNQNTNIESFPDTGPYLWRSNEIINNAIAYDLLKGAQVPDSLLTTGRGLLMEMAGNLYGEVKFNLFNLGFFGLHPDNHALRTCGALGLAGIVLSDETPPSGDEDPSKWFQTALYQIDNVLWRDGDRQSTAGVIGGYSEGPHYLRFGMKHVLPFFHSLHNYLPDTTFSVEFSGDTRSVQHPWHDTNYDLLFEWVPRIQMPDGRSPALEDCFVATAYEDLAIMERPEWCIDVDYSRWAKVQPGTMWKMLRHSSDDMIADYLASRTYDAPDTFPHFQALNESGNLVFRSGWDSAATYLHFTAKNGKARTSAQGHNQGDATSFILFSHRELLALDPGYLKWDRRTEVGEPGHHNLILVDNDGPANGQIANAGGADAFLDLPIDLPGWDFSQVRSNYEGAEVRRWPLMVRKQYFILGDDVTSSSNHAYKWQLHGYGLENGDSLTGWFTEEMGKGATWTRNDAHLKVTLTAKDMAPTLSKATQKHEWAYDTSQNHTALYGELTNTADARFLSVLFPYSTDTPTVELFSNPGALYVETDAGTDLVTVSGSAPATQLGFAGDVTSDGKMAVLSFDTAQQWSGFFLHEGSNLYYGGNPVAFLGQTSTTALERIDAETYRGYISTGGTLEISGLPFWPQSVNGIPVSGFTYYPGSGRLEIQFAGGGYFSIHEDVVVGTAAPQPEWQVYPNPARGLVHVVGAAGKLRLVDVQGRTLREWENGAGEALLDVSDLGRGLYLLVWEGNGRRQTKRLVLE